VRQKGVRRRVFVITSWNTNRFSTFFNWYTFQEIQSTMMITHFTLPQAFQKSVLKLIPWCTKSPYRLSGGCAQLMWRGNDIELVTPLYTRCSILYKIAVCCEAEDGVISRSEACSGIPVTDALELAEDKSFWRLIATAGCYGCRLYASRHDDDDASFMLCLYYILALHTTPACFYVYNFVRLSLN